MAGIPKPSMQPSMGGEDNPEFMEKFYGYVAYLNRQFLICIVLLVVVALIFLSLNLIPCLRPNEISVASWFERPGALKDPRNPAGRNLSVCYSLYCKQH